MEDLADVIVNDMSLERLSQMNRNDRVLFIDLQPLKSPKTCAEMASERPSPRVMKSHLPRRAFDRQLLQDKAKFIVIVRNPKDTLVSLYHFYRMNTDFGLFPGTWDDFFPLIRAGKLMYGDYFDWYQGWWKERELENVLFVKFEDSKKCPAKVIGDIAQFLGRSLSEEECVKLAAATTFEKVQSDPFLSNSIEGRPFFRLDISRFLRKGAVGDWKSHMSPEQSQYIDGLYEEKIKSMGLELSFE